MSEARRAGTAALVTPPAAGAIAIIEITGEHAADIARACAALSIARIPEPGAIALRSCGDVDEALIARPGEAHLLVMPHGGPYIVEHLMKLLRAAGFSPPLADDASSVDSARSPGWDSAQRYALLARAASPLGIDLLLRTPERLLGPPPPCASDRKALMRLIDPPLVVLAGAPNIGKSTLTNALAGRSVAVTCDAPGTTRDSVGVTLNLAGLVVHWLDTPGLRPAEHPVEAAAIELARSRMIEADLLIAAADADSPWPDLPKPANLRIALAADRGPRVDAELQTSAITGEGLRALAARCRDLLVPCAAYMTGG